MQPIAPKSSSGMPGPQSSDSNSKSTAIILGILVVIFASVLLAFVGAGVVLYSRYQAMLEHGSVAKSEKGERVALDARQREKERLQQERAAARQADSLRREEVRNASQKESREKFLAEQNRKARALMEAREQREGKRRQIQIAGDQVYKVHVALAQTKNVTGSENPVYNLKHHRGLSWRVALLPYLGYREIYHAFHLNEPWDSPHNLKLLPQMPSAYGENANKAGLASVRALLRLDGPDPTTSLAEIADGLEWTGDVIHVPVQYAVPWTQPDSDQALPDAAELFQAEGLLCLTIIGQEKEVVFKHQLDLAAFGGLLTTAGGEHFRRIRNRPAPQLVFTPSDPTSVDLDAQPDFMQIAQAINKYAVEARSDRPRATEPNGKLSWRVHLLPYLGEDELYRQFALDEPWDSPQNLALIGKIPEVYQTGAVRGKSRIRSIAAGREKSMLFDLPNPTAIQDDLNSTCSVFWAAGHAAVTWTKPDAIYGTAPNIRQSLGLASGMNFEAVTWGGRVVSLPANLHMSKLSALISIAGKESLDLDVALQSPSGRVKLKPTIAPAELVDDIVELPDVAPPTDPVQAAEPDIAKQRESQMRKIALGGANFYDRYRKSPARVPRSDGALSGLSWRVHLLPLLGEENLYQMFNLEESWDSPQNKKLLDRMPRIFATSDKSSTHTSIQIPTGPESLWATHRWLDAPDSTSNTIMVAWLPDSHAIQWTKPEWNPIEELFSLDSSDDKSQTFTVALGNASTITLPIDFPDAALRAMLTRSGGESLDAGTVRRWSSHARNEVSHPFSTRDRWEGSQMKELVLGCLNFESVYGFFPPQMRPCSEQDAIPLQSSMLSWRVHLLPFIGHEKLYKKFRLEEPWDSPHNSQLAKAMPDVYREANAPASSTLTRIVRLVGPGSPFPEVGLSCTARGIPDGTSNTISLIAAPSSMAVPWTQPVDLQADLTSDASDALLEQLKKNPAGILIARFDGSVVRLPGNIPTKVLRSMLTHRGGEVITWR